MSSLIAQNQFTNYNKFINKITTPAYLLFKTMAVAPFPHFGTKAIHTGQEPEQWECKALVPPIFTATTYKQDEPGKPVSS